MIYSLKDWKPKIAPTAYIHESSVIIGRVTIGDKASVWPLAALRGDVDEIIIGDESNVQDCCALHVNFDSPLVLGKGVTVGHSVVLHGCKIGDHCLVGMNAVVMESEIGENCIIAAGTLIPAGKKIPSGSLVMGSPGKVVRALSPDEIKSLIKSKDVYLELAEVFKKECVKL